MSEVVTKILIWRMSLQGIDWGPLIVWKRDYDWGFLEVGSNIRKKKCKTDSEHKCIEEAHQVEPLLDP